MPFHTPEERMRGGFAVGPGQFQPPSLEFLQAIGALQPQPQQATGTGQLPQPSAFNALRNLGGPVFGLGSLAPSSLSDAEGLQMALQDPLIMSILALQRAGGLAQPGGLSQFAGSQFATQQGGTGDFMRQNAFQQQPAPQQNVLPDWYQALAQQLGQGPISPGQFRQGFGGINDLLSVPAPDFSQLPPVPQAQIPAAPDFSRAREALAQGQPQPPQPITEQENILNVLAGLAGGGFQGLAQTGTAGGVIGAAGAQAGAAAAGKLREERMLQDRFGERQTLFHTLESGLEETIAKAQADWDALVARTTFVNDTAVYEAQKEKWASQQSQVQIAGTQLIARQYNAATNEWEFHSVETDKVREFLAQAAMVRALNIGKSKEADLKIKVGEHELALGMFGPLARPALMSYYVAIGAVAPDLKKSILKKAAERDPSFEKAMELSQEGVAAAIPQAELMTWQAAMEVLGNDEQLLQEVERNAKLGAAGNLRMDELVPR